MNKNKFFRRFSCDASPVVPGFRCFREVTPVTQVRCGQTVAGGHERSNVVASPYFQNPPSPVCRIPVKNRSIYFRIPRFEAAETRQFCFSCKTTRIWRATKWSDFSSTRRPANASSLQSRQRRHHSRLSTMQKLVNRKWAISTLE